MDRQNLVGGNFLQALHRATGPSDFEESHYPVAAQPEMDSFVTGREIASGGTDVTVLFAARLADQPQTSADPVPVARASNGVHKQPVIAVAPLVEQDESGPVVAINSDVDGAVIVQVTEGRPPGLQRLMEGCAALRGDIIELAALITHEQQRFAVLYRRLGELDVVHYVALADE